jgi:hypothetical protein
MENTHLENAVLQIMKQFEQDDEFVRDDLLRLYKKGDLFWQGYQHLFWDSTQANYRDATQLGVEAAEAGIDPNYLRVINIYRAHGESIIAALSVDTPAVTFFPADPRNPNDLATAENYEAAAILIQRHNQSDLRIAEALYQTWVSGLVAAYVTVEADEKYGVYRVPKYEDTEETETEYKCPECGNEVGQFSKHCSNCQSNFEAPVEETRIIVVPKIVGLTEDPKTQVKIRIFGLANVKVYPYVKELCDSPYLIYEFEEHISTARARYPDRQIMESTDPSGVEREARDPASFGNIATSRVTTKCVWLRPSAYHFLVDKDTIQELKRKYPRGVHAEIINDQVCMMEEQAIEDCWVIATDPTASHIHPEPKGKVLFDPNEIMNEIVNLALETMEQGIPQTFADAQGLDFDRYREEELTPGMLIPVTRPPNGSIGDLFYTTRTASMSQEIDKFETKIEQKAQLVAGAFPSIYGGTLQGGSKTFAEYAASRQQALQRLGLTWRMLANFWANVIALAVPMYVKSLQEDETFALSPEKGNFTAVTIYKDAVNGRIGRVEPTNSNAMPLSWGQKRDTILDLFKLNIPEINMTLLSPENSYLLTQLSGIPELKIPGEDSRWKQFNEIQQLIMTAGEDPQAIPPGSTVPVSEFDEHAVEIPILRAFINSKAGQDLKLDNTPAYVNILSHLRSHMNFTQQQPMPVEGVENGPGGSGNSESAARGPFRGNFGRPGPGRGNAGVGGD